MADRKPLEGITFHGVPLIESLKDIACPVGDGSILKEASEKHYIYKHRRPKMELKEKHGEVKMYSDNEKFMYVLSKISPESRNEFHGLKIPTRNKLSRLLLLYQNLPVSFTNKELDLIIGNKKESSRTGLMLRQAQLIAGKKDQHRRTAYTKHPASKRM